MLLYNRKLYFWLHNELRWWGLGVFVDCLSELAGLGVLEALDYIGIASFGVISNECYSLRATKYATYSPTSSISSIRDSTTDHWLYYTSYVVYQ